MRSPSGGGAMAGRARRAKYTGVLAEPMVWQPPLRGNVAGLFEKSAEELAQLESDQKAQWDERVSALFDHYQIDKSSLGRGFALAIALARTHVPGFQIHSKQPKGRGKPAKWRGEQGVER